MTYTVVGSSDRAVSVTERRMVAARGRTSMTSTLSRTRNWKTPAKAEARVVEEKMMEILTDRAEAMAVKAGTVRGEVARSPSMKSCMLGYD